MGLSFISAGKAFLSIAQTVRRPTHQQKGGNGEECQKEGGLVAAEQTRPRAAGQHAEVHSRHLQITSAAPERRIKLRRN